MKSERANRALRIGKAIMETVLEMAVAEAHVNGGANMLTIDRCAVSLRNGDIVSLPRPNRHSHVLWDIMDRDGEDAITGHLQGFIDSSGEFRNRENAARIALDAGQVQALRWPPYLFSEDLW